MRNMGMISISESTIFNAIFWTRTKILVKQEEKKDEF